MTEDQERRRSRNNDCQNDDDFSAPEKGVRNHCWCHFEKDGRYSGPEAPLYLSRRSGVVVGCCLSFRARRIISVGTRPKSARKKPTTEFPFCPVICSNREVDRSSQVVTPK